MKNNEANKKVKIVLENLGGDHNTDIFNKTSNGDYMVTKVKHESYGNNERAGILVMILFKAQYGYYLVNNYLPSLLIFIIAYSTFYFPINNFNERVMVSLTSELVLASFFTQASESTVHTPYVKMLDAWFAGLICFNFVIVILNVAIHSSSTFKSNSISVQKFTKPLMKEEKIAPATINKWAKVSIAAAFIIFLSGYALAAL